MSDPAAAPAAAPAQPEAAATPNMASTTNNIDRAPKRLSINTKGIAIAILVVVAFVALGPKLATVRDNLMQRTVNATDPSTPWTFPPMNNDTIFMVVVIVIALALMLKRKGR